MLMWWGDVGSNARTSDSSVVGDVVGFGINPGSDRVYNSMTGAWEETYNESPNMAYLGWGVYVTSRVSGDEKKRKAAWSAAAHLGGKDLSFVDGGLSFGLPAVSQLALPIRRMGSGGLRSRLCRGLSGVQRRQLQPPPTRPSNRASPASSNTIRWPRMNCPKAMPGNTHRRRKPPTPLPPHGKRSPTRSAATARLRCTRPAWACDPKGGAALAPP